MLLYSYNNISVILKKTVVFRKDDAIGLASGAKHSIRASSFDVSVIPFVVLPGVGVAIGLAITAVVTGSIDLKF